MIAETGQFYSFYDVPAYLYLVVANNTKNDIIINPTLIEFKNG